jgi:carbonic anhydrase
MFDDLIEANRQYAQSSHDSSVAGRAARGLAVVTCMDSRIDPLGVLGLKTGDAKIIRNAGARVTDDALRSLILAVKLLGADRICVMQHSRCAMVTTEEEMRARVGAGAENVEFLAMPDQRTALRADLQRIRDCALIPGTTEIAGFVFDVDSGELIPSG